MSQSDAWSVEEAQGRALYAQLVAEADEAIERYDWPLPATPPLIPRVARTDTGTMRAIVVNI